MSKKTKEKPDKSRERTIPINGGEEETVNNTAEEAAAPEAETEKEDFGLEDKTDREAGGEQPESASAENGEEAPAEEKNSCDEKIAELNDRNLRLMAEFENYRKRTEKEKEQMFENGAKSVIEKVLPVIDNFERALDMSGSGGEAGAEADPFMEGMQKIYRQLMDELSKLGVKPIEAVGCEFNPEYHNAVMQVDSDEYESGVVASEMQKGYMYNDSVVRHSMVGVAK